METGVILLVPMEPTFPIQMYTALHALSFVQLVQGRQVRATHVTIDITTIIHVYLNALTTTTEIQTLAAKVVTVQLKKYVSNH